MRIDFSAAEYCADDTFATTHFAFEGSPEHGWVIERGGAPHLELGPGYRLLRTVACGVCSTDLARRFLPFPLPQITGHEVLAVDESGARHVVEINASHAARGLDANCPFCRAGLDHHCPDRLVLGIHDLPGGFGPHVLAPVGAAIPIPDAIPSSSAVLVEPMAAAVHAVTDLQPREGDRIAVLGPGRLGLLIVAALNAYRATKGLAFDILALARRPALLELAGAFGADTCIQVEDNGDRLPDGVADVVIDTTGNPDGLALAVRLAKREVHLKSTHGRPAVGLHHLTELVVDEIGIGSFCEDDDFSGQKIAWLADRDPPADFAAGALYRQPAAELLSVLESGAAGGGLPRVDLAVVDDVAQIDVALRPGKDREVSPVKPRGRILLHPALRDRETSLLAEAVVARGLKLSSSRCGDFQDALHLMISDDGLRTIGDKFITHRFPADRIEEAFRVAASPGCVKAVVEQDAVQ